MTVGAKLFILGCLITPGDMGMSGVTGGTANDPLPTPESMCILSYPPPPPLPLLPLPPVPGISPANIAIGPPCDDAPDGGCAVKPALLLALPLVKRANSDGEELPPLGDGSGTTRPLLLLLIPLDDAP